MRILPRILPCKPSLVPTLLSFAAFLAIPVLADFQAGLDAFQKGDYITAAKEWRPLAEQGVPIAQFNLGLLYLDGHGVPQSDAEAANWFRRAAEQDYAPAQQTWAPCMERARESSVITSKPTNG